MSFISFSTNAVAIPVAGAGILNGYKLNSIMHTGRKINLTPCNYYYIPFTKQIVSFRGSKAKPMAISSDNKYSFMEKYTDRRGQWNFKADAEMVHLAAIEMFGY